ncbi:MAG: hypothetical protein ACM31C_17485 [Acidobacteriota bacterium]
MRWGLLVTLCACDSIFGLQPTKQGGLDAKFFDAPADAPFTCPPLGTTPFFQTQPQQAVFDSCVAFQTTADGSLALAACTGQLAMGPVSGPLAPVADLAMYGTFVHQNASLSPEGDQVLVSEPVSGTQINWIRYLAAGGGHWTRGDTLVWPSPITSSVYGVSQPTLGPTRHMMALDNGGYLDEVIDDGTPNLQLARRYGQGDLGVYNYRGPSLAPDGLRLVIYATRPDGQGHVLQSLWYSDRPSIDVDFRAFEPILAVVVTDPFLRVDCGRLYFSGIGSIWYVQPQ